MTKSISQRYPIHPGTVDDGEINQIVQTYKEGKVGGDTVIRQELEAGLSGDKKAMGNIFNLIANFFKDFFDKLKAGKK